MFELLLLLPITVYYFRAVIKGRAIPSFLHRKIERERGKKQKQTSCLISHLHVVLTRQLEILVTALLFPLMFELGHIFYIFLFKQNSLSF